MIPSDGGGGAGWFDWSADIILPFLGIVAAVAIPLVVLYRQRDADAKQLAAERAHAEEERLREARKRASRDAVAALAPFIGLVPYGVDTQPMMANLRVALMTLVDEFPADHPINDLVGLQLHLGVSEIRSIRATDKPIPRPSVSKAEADRQLAEIVNPLHGWAGHFTNDLRLIQAEGASEEWIVNRTASVRGELETLHHRNGWEAPPPSTIRRRLPGDK